jgi:hypothetical protein
MLLHHQFTYPPLLPLQGRKTMFEPEPILMSDGKFPQNLSPDPQQKITVSDNVYTVVSTTIINKVVDAIWGTLAGGTNRACVMGISNYTNEDIKYAGTYLKNIARVIFKVLRGGTIS